MRLTVVGCSGSFPGPESPGSCYLVEADGFRLVLDMGNGSLGVLQRYADIYALDAVALSHLHADHCLDLCSYYVARRYHPDGRKPPVPIYGPTDTAGRLARAYDIPEEPGMTGEFDFRVYPSAGPAGSARVGGSSRSAGPVGTASEWFEIGPFRVRTARMAHPVEAYALRIEHAGSSLVFSGDTGPCEALVELSRGVDLLLAEASFVEGEDNPPDLHMTGREAGQHAERAGVGRLVVTHVPPWYDVENAVTEAKTAFSGAVDAARTGAIYEL